MATNPGAIQVPDSGTADVGTRVGQLAGTTVEAQLMVVTDGDVLDNHMKVNATGELAFQSGNSLSNSQVSVGIASTQLSAADTGRKTFMVQNGSDDAYLWVGSTGVTDSNGFRVAPRSTLTLENYKGAVFGVFTAVTTTCFVLETDE